MPDAQDSGETTSLETVTCQLSFTELPKDSILGLRQGWLSADMPDGVTVDLSAGTGLGSPVVAFTWSDAEGYHAYTADIRDIFTKLIDHFHLAERRTDASDNA